MTPRKQNRIAERENAILEIATGIIAREGTESLTMERVLAQVDFSKGTLYNHFICREDLLVAVHAQCFARHLEYFTRGAVFRGEPRERFVATGMGHNVLQLVDPRPFRFALTEAILAAASENWRERFRQYHHETLGIFTGIVRDAIAVGDLPAATDPDHVTLGAWSVSCGAEELHTSGLMSRPLDGAAFARLRSRLVDTLLDGFGWRPLSSENNYDLVRKRALREVYPEEARRAGLLPS